MKESKDIKYQYVNIENKILRLLTEVSVLPSPTVIQS